MNLYHLNIHYSIIPRVDGKPTMSNQDLKDGLKLDLFTTKKLFFSFSFHSFGSKSILETTRVVLVKQYIFGLWKAQRTVFVTGTK